MMDLMAFGTFVGFVAIFDLADFLTFVAFFRSLFPIFLDLPTRGTLFGPDFLLANLSYPIEKRPGNL
jgi:hypothetical protein